MKKSQKTTAADLFGSDIDDDSDADKPTNNPNTATQVRVVNVGDAFQGGSAVAFL